MNTATLFNPYLLAKSSICFARYIGMYWGPVWMYPFLFVFVILFYFGGAKENRTLRIRLAKPDRLPWDM